VELMMADTDVLFQAEPFSVHTIGHIRFDFIHIFRQTASIWTSMSENDTDVLFQAEPFSVHTIGDI
jgi:hypothetical protein